MLARGHAAVGAVTGSGDRVGDGSGREIGDAQAEVFGRQGKTLILVALLLLLPPGLSGRRADSRCGVLLP